MNHTKKIIIAGGTGFLGEALTKALSKSYTVLVLSRKKGPDTLLWDGETLGNWVQELEGAYAVINLSGKNIDWKFTEENKKQILDSRIRSTTLIGKAIEACKTKPKVWMNASGANYYQYSLTQPMTEANGIAGTDFMADVCQKWEQSFFKFKYPNVRQIALRTTAVLGEKGALKPLKILAKLGLGGTLASGKQMFSWIHVDDYAAAVQFLLEHESSEGIYNMAAPNPINNKDFMKVLREAVHMPIGIPAPELLVRIGAQLIGKEAELILGSVYVVPERLQNEGFAFKFSNINEALNDLI